MLNNKYLTEFLGTLFLLYVILASGNPLAIGAALAAAVMVGKSSEVTSTRRYLLPWFAQEDCP